MNQKKLTRLFITIILLFTLLVSLTVTVLLMKLSLELQLFIFLLIALVFYFVMIYFKNKFERYRFLVQNEKLFSNLSDPFSIEIIPFENSFEKKIKSLEMALVPDLSNITSYYYYKHFEPNMSRSRTLVMYNFIDEALAFNDDLVLDEISSVDTLISKKSKYNHKVIFIIKVTDTKTSEKLKEVYYPFWLKSGNEHLALIQAYIFKDTKEIYFVNNNSYSPTRYYKHASDELIDFFKNR